MNCLEWMYTRCVQAGVSERVVGPGGRGAGGHSAGSSCQRAFKFHIHHSQSKNGKVLNAKCCTCDGCNVLEAHIVKKKKEQ